MPAPIHPRRSWFAVWHWPWWTWMIVVPLLPLWYFVSAPPIDVVLMKTGAPRWFYSAVIHLYAPARWCARNSETLSAVWEWERTVLKAIFGLD